jgi:tripartite-type tricarboxylate transporter receptor subunit TctC
MIARILAGLAALAIMLLDVAPAHAQYPTKTIRFIVPFAAGSANDVVARLVGPALSDALGRPVVIDNRPGAAGNIGAELAAKSPPDGYTLMMGNIAHSVSMTLYDKPGYDLVKDFAPVTQLAAGSFLVTVHPSVPAKSVKQLVALARARPGEINAGVSGAGIILASELFQSMTRSKMTQVAYKSTPQAITALLSGEVSVGFPSTSAAIPHVRSAKLRGLAVTSARRSSIALDIPTVAEAGVPGYEAAPWYGMLVPAGTSPDIVARLHAESVKTLARPDVRKLFSATDIEPVGSTPAQFAAHLRDEIAKWGKIIKAIGMRPE